MTNKDAARIAPTTDWYGLYGEGWQGEIVPEAFAHPAKYSRGLIRHIYQHMMIEGWLTPGDTVLDCFGGVALGALDAMVNGLNWCGVELEQRFVDLGNQNIDLWNTRYGGKLPRWGTARLIQGDSRELLRYVAEAGCVVSSPPYAETPIEQTHMTSNKRGDKDNPNYRPSWEKKLGDGYADTTRPYGITPGQLGAMKAGDVDAVVSSPPWEGCMPSTEDDDMKHGAAGNVYTSTKGLRTRGGDRTSEKAIKRREEMNSRINLGAINTSGNNGKELEYFWIEAQKILAQVYAALRPGGHAVWVVKSFVKDKHRVDFPGQWQRLCEAAGFVTVHQHRAWLVEDRGAQYDLTGERIDKTVERKSFFRRLAEKKGSPRIDYEVVLCMVKPGSEGDGAAACVSSPPFQESLDRGVVDPAERRKLARSRGITNAEFISPIDMESIGQRNQSYGTTPGNLGNMKPGRLEDVL